jgi:hypothetical protein
VLSCVLRHSASFVAFPLLVVAVMACGKRAQPVVRPASPAKTASLEATRPLERAVPPRMASAPRTEPTQEVPVRGVTSLAGSAEAAEPVGTGFEVVVQTQQAAARDATAPTRVAGKPMTASEHTAHRVGAFSLSTTLWLGFLVAAIAAAVWLRTRPVGSLRRRV